MSKRKMNSKVTNKSLERLYAKYKSKIDAGYSYLKDPKMAFMMEVKEIARTQSLSPSKAVQKLFKSEVFVPEIDRLKNNVLQALRNTKKDAPGQYTAYDKWRQATRHQKIDKDKLTYKGWDNSGSYQVYEYVYQPTKTVQIVLYRSPQGIDVLKLW